ncbi:MAG: aminopeptidase P family protein [Bryobacteraceae bacterium]|nr:aminopeptidase P family protein [Bryobacteraceae bacterium]
MSTLAQRRTALTAQFAEQKVQAALISGLPNVRYLSGFTGSHAMLLVLEDSATLFTDPRYTLQASAESDCRVVIARNSFLPGVLKLVARLRIRKLGIEPERMHVSTMLYIQKAARTLECVPLPPLVERLRMVKSEDEIDAIRRSALINSRAYDRALLKIRPAMTENELASEIDYGQRRFGAEGSAFASIVAAGERSALPHATPGSQPLGTNRLLLMDVGALLGGYCSDMTRVVHLGLPGTKGSPGTKAKKLYRAVLEAQLAAIDAVRPGKTASSVDRAARQVLKQHGLAEVFVHSTGHGLGLEIHEPPRIGRTDKTRLQEGMAITIEPGAYLEGFGGVRIEDTVLVTRNGCEILTPTSKEFVVV